MQNTICLKCGGHIPNKIIIDDKSAYLHAYRKYCLICSPYKPRLESLDNYVLNQTQMQILQGHLLGDGYCLMTNSSANAYFGITRKLEDKDYLLWSANNFSECLTPDSIRERVRYDKRTKNTYYSIVMNTRSARVFTEQYAKWYKNGKKIIPIDLTLTPLVLAVWIADDGCIFSRKTSKTSETTICLTIGTNGFEYTDVQFIYEQLVAMYGNKIYMYEKKRNQYVISTSHKQTVKLICRDIDPFFPPMSRKSDIWLNTEIDLWNDTVYNISNTPLFACPYCNSKDVIKKGIYKTSIVESQKYLCKECGEKYKIPLTFFT